MRQSSSSRTYKIGYTAGEFQLLDWVTLFGYTANAVNSYVTETGVPGIDYVYDEGGIMFAANVDAPASAGMLSPQVVVLPAKDKVNVKASIVWDDATGVGEKVGWFLYCQHTLVGEPLMGAIGDGFTQGANDPTEPDYTNTLAPGYDSLWAFPRSQYAIGYGTADQMVKSTPMYHLRYDTPTTLKLDNKYAFKGMEEYIDNTYVLLTMYIYRMQGLSPLLSSFLQDGVYDADGCGNPDTDNFAGTARFLGLLLEFD